MLLIMGVTLYTSRVILQTLGIDDYGIYNLIAGFVTLFSFISNALVNAMQRFFNVAIGRNDNEVYKRYYSMSFNILVVFSLVVLFLGETLGYWFVQTKLNIPIERQNAAMWTYQFALFTFIANIIRTPYNASIIAYEKMSFYAYVSIAEVILRLAVVILLSHIRWDKLILYSILYFILIIFIAFVYRLYCKSHFSTCKYVWAWDKGIFKELLSFSSWSLMGQSAVVVTNQGQAVFINHFFSVSANAAMGVAGQLTSAIDQFVINFQTAFNPQITKTFAIQDYEGHYKLLFRASRFSFYLLLVLMLPVCFNINTLLELWLTEVPQYTDRFCISILISYLFAAYSCPFTTSIFATGNIKQYEIFHTIIFLITLFLSYVALAFGFNSYVVADIGIFTQISMLLLRLYCAKKEASVSVINYLKQVIMPTAIVTTISLLICYPIHFLAKNTVCSLLSIILSILMISLVIYAFGLDKTERIYIKSYFKRRHE